MLYVPPKCQFLQEPQDITAQKIFFIVTTKKTSNHAKSYIPTEIPTKRIVVRSSKPYNTVEVHEDSSKISVTSTHCMATQSKRQHASSRLNIIEYENK
jgi:transposase